MTREELWEKAAAFHGHKCGGLAIGWAASLLAMELLGISEPSPDEEIVCISENDACGIDAIQSILGCTAGKGNLLFRLCGKQAFSFFNRQNGESFRLVLKELPPMARGEKMSLMLAAEPKEFFIVKKPAFGLPEEASIFNTAKCSACGETTAEPWLRVRESAILCLDCYEGGPSA